MRWITVAWLALLAPWAVLAQPGPLTNGGFEESRLDGGPADWELLGSAQVETVEAHSGQRVLHLLRTPETQGEVGLNRAWSPTSGGQGAMLAERKGAVRFWYKAASADPADSLQVIVVPMNGTPQEVGGQRTQWIVPASHLGDGEWHQGALAYDYSGNADIQWVHVAARLTGTEGDMWLDDFEWLPEVGPVLQCAAPTIEEVPGEEGLAAELTVTVRNVGDAPLPAGTVSFSLPTGLTAEPAEPKFAEIAPRQQVDVPCMLTGRRSRSGQQIGARASAGGQETSSALTLRSTLHPASLRLAALVAKPGEPLEVELLAENRGTVMLPVPPCELTVPEGVEAGPGKPVTDIPPGVTAPVARWQVTVAAPRPFARIAARVKGAPEVASSYVVCAPRLPGTADATEADCALYAGSDRAFAAHRPSGESFVGTDRVRLALTPVSSGALLGALQVRDGEAWRTVAVLPYLGLLATPEAESVLRANGPTSVKGGVGAELRLAGATDLGGIRWRTEWRFSVQPGADTVHYALSARPDADAEVLALEGPMLQTETPAGAEREDAILPGLEWLVRGEESSNALDIKPEHPDRLRVVPHPRKITVPAAAVRTGDTVVGLLWDTPPMQESAGASFAAEAGPASVVFASPDRFEGHPGSTMGLFLPSVGEWVPENARRATKPLPVERNRALSLSADLLATAGASGCLVALERWYGLHGWPEPLPSPRGDLLNEIEFSLRGYLKDRALWNPTWRKWYTDLIVGFQPTDAPADDLLRGAGLLPPGEAPDAARALAAEALGGDERTLALRTQSRADPAGLAALARAVRGLIASQQADGNWAFGGPKAGPWPEKGVNYDVLGAVGACEVGLTAPNATRVLQLALLTGDPEASAAGLRALEAMRAFRVPRAAQVWEVPVHTPDILACSAAVDAYLLGYRLTGDPALLEEAVYWARTGLPFVYVWAPRDLPAMQGASVPVFGATGYGLSWFGVAVQWNGLAYAESLAELSRYDKSFAWARVSEALYRSAMYQQATEGDRLAQWPDAVNLIPGRPGLHGQTPPCFQPSSILRHLFREAGLHVTSEVIVVRQKDGQLAIRAGADIADARWDGGRLSFTLRFGPGERGAAEVIATTRPVSVSLDGEALEERDDLWTADQPGWRWIEQGPMLEVRVTETGEHTIEVEGARRAELALGPPLRTEIDFSFAENLDGWLGVHDLAPLGIADGRLVTQSTGADPYMTREGLLVEGREGDALVVRLSLSGGQGSLGVFWGTEDDPGTSPARELSARCPADGAIQEVRLPLGEHPQWAGHRVLLLRLDPGGDAPGAGIAIESIRLARAGEQ